MSIEALIPLLIWFVRPAGFGPSGLLSPRQQALSWAVYALAMAALIVCLRLKAFAQCHEWNTRSWVPSAIRFGSWQRLAMGGAVVVHAAMVWAGPMGRTLDQLHGWLPDLYGGRDLLVTLASALPLYITMIGLWWAAYPVSAAARQWSALDALEADLPVRTTPPARVMVGLQVRTRLGLTLAQWLVLTLFTQLWQWAIGLTRWHGTSGSEVLILAGSAMGTVLLSPLIVRLILPTQPLPDSPLRTRLTAIAAQSRIRLGGVFLWQTHGTAANAMVSGFFWPLRYVFISDHLLETFTDAQVSAVMSHELGHVRRRHILWYAVLVTGVAMGLRWAAIKVDPLLELWLPPAAAGGWLELCIAIVSTVGGLAVVLGLFVPLSRAFEGQADLEGATLCSGGTVTRAGAMAMADALLRVAQVNGIPPQAGNLTHGSIAGRMAKVVYRGSTVESASRFHRQLRLIKCIMAIGWIALAAAMLPF